MNLSDNDRELILHQLLYTIPKEYWGTIRLILWFLYAFTSVDKAGFYAMKLVDFIQEMERDNDATD